MESLKEKITCQYCLRFYEAEPITKKDKTIRVCLAKKLKNKKDTNETNIISAICKNFVPVTKYWCVKNNCWLTTEMCLNRQIRIRQHFKWNSYEECKKCTQYRNEVYYFIRLLAKMKKKQQEEE